MAFEWERDEWWHAATTASEFDRAASCGHTYNRGICTDCGDDEPRRDMW